MQKIVDNDSLLYDLLYAGMLCALAFMVKGATFTTGDERAVVSLPRCFLVVLAVA